MKRAIAASVLALAFDFLGGCSPQNTSLTLPGYSPSFTYPTATGYTSSGIQFNFYYELDQYTGDDLVGGTVYVNGASVTNASVTLITPGGSYGIPEYNWYYQQVLLGNFTYYPGQIYTLQVSTTAGVASAACTMPGPPTISPNGLELTWPLPSNAGGLNISKGSTFNTVYGAYGIWPPYYMPATIFSSGSGTYQYDVQLSWDAYSFVNAEPGSKFQCQTRLEYYIVK
jgi:hypothetical protein